MDNYPHKFKYVEREDPSGMPESLLMCEKCGMTIEVFSVLNQQLGTGGYVTSSQVSQKEDTKTTMPCPFPSDEKVIIRKDKDA